MIGRALKFDTRDAPPTYSVCTLVTRPAEYQEMCDSFIGHGFTLDDTEYLQIDNSQATVADAFLGYNRFLVEARSPYIILCHQDVLLLEDGRDKLDQLVAELDRLDPDWALLGNSGPRSDGRLATRISDPYSEDRTVHGPFPARVTSLDENFIVVRREANLCLSHDLRGFHMYGPDLTLMAELMGWHAYVVDFHLRHKSGGTKDTTYYECRRAFREKYEHAFRSRWLQIPTLYPVFLSGSPLRSKFARFMHKLGFWPRLKAPSALGEK